MAKFYTYRQNNSGGYFDKDDTLAEFVIIEANSASEADDKAVEIGIYFDGVWKEIDCPCCGDRWEDITPYDEEGTDVPMLYGKTLSEYNPLWRESVVIHHLNGLVERIDLKRD